MILTADEIIDNHLNLVGPTKFDVYSNREAVKEAMIMFATQEISDHEIKKGIKRVWNYTDYERRHWMEQGAIWYREQLNLRK
jgi:hypothetical protein